MKQDLYCLFVGEVDEDNVYWGEIRMGTHKELYEDYQNELSTQEQPIIIFGKVLERAVIQYEIDAYEEGK